MAYAEMQVVGRRPASSGAIPQRSSKDGMQVVMDGHPSYLQAALDGNCYIGANAAGTPVTPQAGLTKATPILALFNPTGSGKYLFLWEFGYVLTTQAGAINSISLAVSGPAELPGTNTLAVVTNVLTDRQGGSPVGQCYQVTTLIVTPVAYYYCGGTSVTSITPYGPMIYSPKLAIGPGYAVSIQAKAAQGAYLAHFVWEECEQSMAS